MRKDVLSNKTAKLRIKHLLAEGYNKSQIARMARLNNRTIHNILDPNNEFVRLETYNKLQALWQTLETQKEAEQVADSYFFTDEDVIDRKDAEEGAKEVALWLGITIVVLLLATLGLIFVIKYIFSL
ncbi:MAG: hypothetical protein ACO3UU_01910 [Minisyncoccia bacterium]